jgi:hypothetical protein
VRTGDRELRAGDGLHAAPVNHSQVRCAAGSPARSAHIDTFRSRVRRARTRQRTAPAERLWPCLTFASRASILGWSTNLH